MRRTELNLADDVLISSAILPEYVIIIIIYYWGPWIYIQYLQQLNNETML